MVQVEAREVGEAVEIVGEVSDLVVRRVHLRNVWVD
jgi:hypothetical protein